MKTNEILQLQDDKEDLEIKLDELRKGQLMSINEKSKESGEQDVNTNEQESELEHRKLLLEEQQRKYD